MAIVRATEDVDWYQEFDVSFGKDHFFCKGSECLPREEGYCRLHELNKHLMQLHKMKASNSGGEGQPSSPPGLRTRSSMRHSGGRPQGFRHAQAVEASRGRMQQRKLNGKRPDQNYAAWVELKSSLQQSLRTISNIISKSKGKRGRRKKTVPVFKADEVGNDGDLQWTPRPIVPMGSPPRNARQRPGQMPCPKGGAHRPSGPLFPTAFIHVPSPLDHISPGSPEMRRRPNKGKGRPPVPVPVLENIPLKLKKGAGPGLLTWLGVGLPTTPTTDESNYDAYSPPLDVFSKTPPTISKADPSMMHLSAFHSVKEVIESINDTTPVRQYDVDRQSPEREPRGSSNRRPILLDSPVQSTPVDDVKAPLRNCKSALNVKWDGGGKQSFMVPIYGKTGRAKENAVEASTSHTAAFSPPTVTNLLKEVGESPVGSGILHASPIIASPQSLGLSELLAKVDNLSPVSLPCLVRNPVHGKPEKKVHNVVVPFPSPTKTISEVCEASTQSISSMEYDVEHAIANKDRDKMCDDASDSF